MKKQEFNLSEKIDLCNNPQCKRICVSDIKEFIKLLKDATFEWFCPEDEKHFNSIIDKLAGDKLI